MEAYQLNNDLININNHFKNINPSNDDSSKLVWFGEV